MVFEHKYNVKLFYERINYPKAFPYKLYITLGLTLTSKGKDLHFDVSQTDGEPILELEAKELLSTVEGYKDFKQAVINVAPIPIDFEDIPGDSKGYFSTTENWIAVQEGICI